MIDLALFIIEHLSLAGLTIVLGLILDYVSTPTLKRQAVDWLKKGTLSIPLQEILSIFLSGFLFRILGKELFSIRFFVRSSALSCLFFLVIVALQFSFQREPLKQFSNLGPSLYLSCLAFTVLLATNFVIDYISNVQTIVFLRMASYKGRPIESIVAFYSDVLVTLAIFTFLFPAAILLCAEILLASNTKVKFALVETSPKFTQLIEGIVPKPIHGTFSADLNLHAVSFKPLKDEGTKDDDIEAKGQIYVYAKDPEAAISVASQQIVRINKSARILNETPSRIEIEAEAPTPRLTIGLFKALYYESYRRSNITRDGFLDIVSLEPTSLSADSITNQALKQIVDGVMVSARCIDGTWKEIENRSKNFEVPCESSGVVLDNTVEGHLFTLMRTASSDAIFPITPFFMTSFTACALYYGAILMSFLGIVILRSASKLSKSQYLDFENKPFTILGMAVFPFLLIVIALTQQFLL
ncbi:hypothetical protein [Rhodopseudomonas sp. BR0M22]|uniref:hypothetical protein n=1 Tax=Rhodopseudomonas sp. BR0M22 TaxID=2269369 RepID=UPI0013DEAA70|nr:hypothetical protein [Rhodopseudomonas sp. BR0M22]NEW91766.1 hypothetical protein [Rhodopseudomonas sp. BR0M22]